MFAIVLNTIDLHGSIQPLHGGVHNERLGTMIMGSAMFNNNICLIFVMTFERIINDRAMTNSDELLVSLMKVGFLSIAFGFIIGALVTYMTRKARFMSVNPVNEVIFVVLGAYTTYMIAHLPIFKFSGDVAIFFYGYFVGHYNKFNLSLDAIRQIGVVLNLIFIATEAVCFMYLGLSFEASVDNKYTNIL